MIESATCESREKFWMSCLSIAIKTESAESNTKVDFYHSLEGTFDKLFTNCITIMGEDLNTQVVREEVFQSTVEKESLHLENNSYGIRLICFTTSKDLRISSTQFQRKEIYKHIWTSPGRRFKSQIGHILINGRHKTV
jgi:hypothetical protein